MDWFRLWHEMIDDPKIGVLNDAQFRTWIDVLCLASMARNNGDTNLDESQISWKVRRNVTETLQKLCEIGVVTFQCNGDGRETAHITNWSKRQFESDDVSKRVAKYRESKDKKT